MKKKNHKQFVKFTIFGLRIVMLISLIASQFFGAARPVSALSAPVITNGIFTSVIMTVNASPDPFALTLKATDGDGDTLTWSIISPASHGTASASGTGTSKAIEYVPTTDYMGLDSFVVQVDDGNGETDSITVKVGVQNYEPNFGVIPDGDTIEGWWGWPLGTPITFSVDDPATPNNPDYTGATTVTEQSTTNHSFQLSVKEFIELKPGFEVIVSDGVNTRSTIVTNLELTTVNPVTDKISGTAEPGSTVVSWACEPPGCQWDGTDATRTVVTESNGNWTADYSVAEGAEEFVFNILPDTHASANQFDSDGDFTRDFPVPDFRAIHVSVYDDDGVEGWEWTLGEVVTITVSRPGESKTLTATVEASPYGSGHTTFTSSFSGEFDIQEGDVVIVTEGSGENAIIRSMTVSNLAPTNINMDTDIVTGVATPDANVDVWVCYIWNCNNTRQNRHVKADTTGVWVANYHTTGPRSDEQTTFNILPGTWVDATEKDADGNSTSYGFAPYPGIVARLTQNQVDAYEYPVGTELAFTINSWSSLNHVISELCDPLDPSAGTCANFQIGSEFTLKPGDKVKVEGGGITFSMSVADIHVTGVNTDNDTVSGTAGDGIDQVNVVLWNADAEVTANVTNNTWTADFTGVYDLKPGNYGIAKWEDGSTWTTDYWSVLNLTVNKAGTGSGTVTSNSSGINCGADCDEAYNLNTVVTLTATPATGSTFTGWGGDPDCADGSVTMTSDLSCIANFTLQQMERAVNGGFNIYSGTSMIPKNWARTSFASTDGKDTGIKKEGAASVRIIGATGTTKTLTQTLSLSGTAGQPFSFSYWVKAYKMPSTGVCRGQVLFYYGTTLKGTKTLNCPTGSTYNWKQATLNSAAPAAYNKVVVKFTFSKASGKAWFDLASLLR